MAAASGIGAGIVTFWLSYWKAERDFRRSKLETLFIAVHRYTHANVVLSMRVMMNQGVDDAFVEMTKAAQDFEQLHLIVNFYYPQLKPNFDQFSKVLNEAILTVDGGLNTSDPEFRQKFSRLVDECLKFEQAIITTSQTELTFPG